MTNAWTKGPWRIDPDDREGMAWNNHIVDASGNNTICFMSHDGTDKNTRGLANARLIAAAPDMAEALEDILPLVGWTNLSDDELRLEADAGNENAPLILKARAALARARGAP